MKITKLLLGTAAVLLSVSTARAADAIVVEAEPMEYVKVCDMYGNGFFYIPGTETCMNINGYVRSTYEHSKRDETSTGGFVVVPSTNTSNWTVRGRLNFDVRNETEYGTLRSELRLQGGDANAAGDQNVAIDRALISLAGFRLGYSDTYFTTNHGYGAGTPAINDGFYQFDQAIFFDYTATLAEGVSMTVGVQDSSGTLAGGTGAAATPLTVNSAASPDFYAGFNATFGALTVAATAIRDSGAGDVTAGGAAFTTSDEWVFKGSAIASLGDSGWQVGGWYIHSDSPWTKYNTSYGFLNIASVGPNATAPNGSRSPTNQQWGVQVNGALSDNFSVYGLYSAASGEANAGDLLAGGFLVDTDIRQWVIGAIWVPATQLSVQFEYQNTSGEYRNTGGNGYDVDTDAFLVRVTRSF